LYSIGASTTSTKTKTLFPPNSMGNAMIIP